MTEEKEVEKKDDIDETLVCNYRDTESVLNTLRHIAASINGTYVLFECGTVVRLTGNENKFTGFYGSTHEFPKYRIQPEDMKKFAKDNKSRWEKQMSNEDVARAYHILVDDGYPYPGESGFPYAGKSFSDRTLIPLWGAQAGIPGAWKCVWPYRKHTDAIFNLVTNVEAPYQANTLAADLRRYDYITPSAYAVVKGDAIIRISKEKPIRKMQQKKFPIPDKREYVFESGSFSFLEKACKKKADFAKKV